MEGRAYDCVTKGRRCDLVDNRLAQLSFEETGTARTVAELQDVARQIQNAHLAVMLNIEHEAYEYPATASEFQDLARTLHRDIFSVTGLSFAGRFRNDDIDVGSGKNRFSGSPPSAIRQHLAELFNDDFPLLEQLKRHSENAFLRSCARFLETFFRIHPFADGNGRVARVFLMLFAKYSGQFKFIPFAEERDSKSTEQYLSALETAHKHAVKKVPGEASDTGKVTDPYRLLAAWLGSHLERGKPDILSEEKPNWISDPH